MKRVLFVLITVVFLGGCKSDRAQMEQALAFRNAVLGADECKFSAVVTTDYGDSIYTFGMDCISKKEGTLHITITEPETIAGITCSVAGETGKLLFDDKVLMFETMTDGQITPVISPWLFMKAIRSGYIAYCGTKEKTVELRIDDTFSDTSFCTEVYFNENKMPVFAEILWQGRRIVSIQISNFSIQ